MTDKKTNVFLSSVYNLYGLSGCKRCGFMESDSLNEYWQILKNIEIPATSCIKSLFTDFHQTDSINKAGKTTTERLIVSVWPVCSKCTPDDYAKCTTRIANGQCKDEFVINLIGKKLFADKYQR